MHDFVLKNDNSVMDFHDKIFVFRLSKMDVMIYGKLNILFTFAHQCDILSKVEIISKILVWSVFSSF